MRITNQMMVNSTMSNIQINKNQLNTMDTQLSTQKKINKPSEDPIIAIRALRLRTSLDQVTQYLNKNIPDAASWLDTTEGAMDEAYNIITALNTYCTQGATDSYSSAERNTIAASLEKLKAAFYAEGDVEYAGRYCFTGYMTDTPLNYQSNEDAKGADYIITQKFTRDDLDTKTAYENFYETDDILNLKYETDANGNLVTPSAKDVHRIRLGYKDLDAAIQKNTKDPATGTITTTTEPFKLTLTDSQGKTSTINVTPITATTAKTVKEQDNYVPKAGEAVFNPTTGEILLADDVYEKLYAAKDFSFTYEKSNFVKGDQNPVMYFDCVNNNKDDYYLGVEYIKKNEDIEYNVNFSQKLKVNTEASDAYNINLGRDIDDLVTSVNNVLDIENQIAKVESMMQETRYSDETSQKKLKAMKEGLTKQKELAESKMTAAFEHGISCFQGYQQELSLAKADVGNRRTRLNLTKSRLTEQKTNFSNLKSQNEDIDLEEVVVGYSAAQLVYNASLSAASKVVQQTLLDFL